MFTSLLVTYLNGPRFDGVFIEKWGILKEINWFLNLVYWNDIFVAVYSAVIGRSGSVTCGFIFWQESLRFCSKHWTGLCINVTVLNLSIDEQPPALCHSDWRWFKKTSCLTRFMLCFQPIQVFRRIPGICASGKHRVTCRGYKQDKLISQSVRSWSVSQLKNYCDSVAVRSW
jgi:hypothetical protein